MRISLGYWQTICRHFGLTVEQETSFVRDWQLSNSDAAYYASTYAVKLDRLATIRSATRALEQELAEFDATLSARISDCVGEDRDVRGAVQRLGQHRLRITNRIAACTSEGLAMADLLDRDWQLLDEARKARDEINRYYLRAVNAVFDGGAADRRAVPGTDPLPCYAGAGLGRASLECEER